MAVEIRISAYVIMRLAEFKEGGTRFATRDELEWQNLWLCQSVVSKCNLQMRTIAPLKISAIENAKVPAFGARSGLSTAKLDAGGILGRWQSEGDARLWKLIVSPEFGERVEFAELTRQLMSRMEKDLGTHLDWVAVIHRNTEHPHVHVALRGVRDDRSPLRLERDS